MSGWLHDVARATRAFRRAPWFFAGLIFVLASAPAPTRRSSASFIRCFSSRCYERSDELVMVWNAANTPSNWRVGSSKETVLAWRDSSSDAVFSDLAVITIWQGSRDAPSTSSCATAPSGSGQGSSRRTSSACLVSPRRSVACFRPDDEASGQTNIVVLSDALGAEYLLPILPSSAVRSR